MPLGEVIGEIIIRPILEIVICGLAYWTGYVFLKAVTFGAMKLAPISMIDEKNRSKKNKKFYQVDWGIWLHLPMKGRFLKAECTIIVGFIIWLISGCVIYFCA